MSRETLIQGHTPSADLASSRRNNPTSTFAAECGLGGPLRFMVENTETGQSQTFDVYEPFVLIGRAPGCHLQLLHPDVCFRHAYCQVIQGRLYVFDLDSRHGTAWGAGLRREGPLTPESRLQIGPFVIRLSRAPAFTRSLEQTAEDWELENEPLENVRLWFENATGRSSHDSMRPLRRQITLLGRSNRCHLKLSDNSVSKAHCAIVRTGIGYWVVDLLGRSGTTLNDQSVRFAPVGSDDRIGAGRFRVRIRELVKGPAHETDRMAQAALDDADSTDMLPAVSMEALSRAISPAEDAAVRQHLAQARDRLMMCAGQLPAAASASVPGASDALILAMMEQFSHLQQQLLTHTQQQMTMLTEMFATLHKAQNDAVMGQLNRIQEISAELNALRAERGTATVPGAPALAPATPSVNTVAVVSADVETASPQVEPPPPSAEAARVSALEHSEAADLTLTFVPTESSSANGSGDDSDVVPVAPPVASVSADAMEGFQDNAIDSELEEDTPVTAATVNNDAPPPPPRAPVPRFDATSHARLTMRISELERERNSRWKRLMQLVSGTPND